MRKLLLILLLAPAITFAQVSIGGHISAVSYFAPESHPSSDGIGYQIETLNINPIVGVDLAFGIGNRFELKTGAQYVNRSFNGTVYCYYCLSPIDGGGGLFFPGGLESQVIAQHYLEIPLTFGYDIVKKEKFRLNTSAGIQAGINLVKIDPEIDFPSREPYQYTTGALAAVQFGWAINEKVEFVSGVNYLYGFNFSNYYNPNSIGISAGILFSTNKK